MKPHIKKINGLWCCGYRQNGGYLLGHTYWHYTPSLAYIGWGKSNLIEVGKG